MLDERTFSSSSTSNSTSRDERRLACLGFSLIECAELLGE
jgi:hypothetical protein